MDEKVLIESDSKDIGKQIGNFLLKVLPIIYVFSIIVYVASVGFESIMFLVAFALTVYIYIPLGIICFVLWFISKNQIIVTDKRISGKAAFGKQIDLPIDSISSVGTIKLIKGMSISTASGNVSFWGIGNRDEIYKVISDLIIARQTKSSAKEEKTTNNSDYTDELKKIKELLDAGIITQEEFDAKKKQLLGL